MREAYDSQRVQVGLGLQRTWRIYVSHAAKWHAHSAAEGMHSESPPHGRGPGNIHALKKTLKG